MADIDIYPVEMMTEKEKKAHLQRIVSGIVGNNLAVERLLREAEKLGFSMDMVNDLAGRATQIAVSKMKFKGENMTTFTKVTVTEGLNTSAAKGRVASKLRQLKNGEFTKEELEKAYSEAVDAGNRVAKEIAAESNFDFKFPCGRSNVRVWRTIRGSLDIPEGGLGHKDRVNPFYTYLFKRFAKKDQFGQTDSGYGQPYFGDYPRAYASIFNPASGQALEDYQRVSAAQLKVLREHGLTVDTHDWVD